MKLYHITGWVRPCLILIILWQSSCRTKNLNADVSKSSVRLEEDIRSNRRHNASLAAQRIVHSIDSSEQVFRVSIVPLDTFSFSFENGFQGRASLVEYSGTVRKTSALKDSLVLGAESQNESQTRIDRKLNETEKFKSKNLRVKSISWLSGFILFGLLILNVWLWIKKERFQS